jgi:hypothetical protein
LILITGVHRSGTSCLTLWLGNCGFDLGFTSKKMKWNVKKLSADEPNTYPIRGGLEYFAEMGTFRLAKEGVFPEVAKQPWGLKYSSFSPMDRLSVFNVSTDPVILLKRDFNRLAQSSFTLHSHSYNKGRRVRKWDMPLTVEETAILAEKRWNLILKAYPNATILEFPKYVHDFEYLWDRLSFIVLTKVSKEKAKLEFTSLVNPSFIRH